MKWSCILFGGVQADVEVSFEVGSLEAAERLDPAMAYDAQRLCSARGADARGGVGPFGLWVLASAGLEEKTAVFFRVFRPAARGGGAGKPVVLMCTDPTKYVRLLHFIGDWSHYTINKILPWLRLLIFWYGAYACRSSRNPNMYQPTFAGFVDTDITNGKISLRSLVRNSTKLSGKKENVVWRYPVRIKLYLLNIVRYLININWLITYLNGMISLRYRPIPIWVIGITSSEWVTVL